MLSKTDWLITQQIARYLSRLSAQTKIGLSKRSPSVSINEADVDDLASESELTEQGRR